MDAPDGDVAHVIDEASDQIVATVTVHRHLEWKHGKPAAPVGLQAGDRVTIFRTR